MHLSVSINGSIFKIKMLLVDGILLNRQYVHGFNGFKGSNGRYGWNNFGASYKVPYVVGFQYNLYIDCPWPIVFRAFKFGNSHTVIFVQRYYYYIGISYLK